MKKSRSKDVMESRKRHPEKVRLELIIHSDVKAQFERLYESNRLTNPELTKPALFERLVKGEKGISQIDTPLCSSEYLDKLKWLADCYAVTPAAMMERLIDAGIKEQLEFEGNSRIKEADSIESPTEAARFLLELFNGDRHTARKEYYRHLQRLNPGWVFDPKQKTDKVSKRYSSVSNRLGELAIKTKAGTPEEIPAL